MCMGALSACMSVCHMQAVPEGARREGIGSPGTGVTDGYKQPYRCWEPDPRLLEEDSVLLTDEPHL